MSAPEELRTARLLLRPFRNEDVEALVRLAGAREVAATTLQIPHPYTELDARKFLAQIAEENDAGHVAVFAITNAATRELCGAVGLHLAPNHRRAELGYWVGVPFWGQGFATEAARAALGYGFQKLALNRIHAQYFSGNEASRRVLEKIGMKHEGRFRRHIQKWDRFVDVENYAILAEEFEDGASHSRR